MESKKLFHLSIIFFLTITIFIWNFSGFACAEDIFPGNLGYVLDPGFSPLRFSELEPTSVMIGMNDVFGIVNYSLRGMIETEPFFLMPGTEFLYKHPLGSGYSPSVRILPFPLPENAVPGWAPLGSSYIFPGSLFPGIATLGGRFSYQTTPSVWFSMGYSDIGMPEWSHFRVAGIYADLSFDL